MPECMHLNKAYSFLIFLHLYDVVWYVQWTSQCTVYILGDAYGIQFILHSLPYYHWNELFDKSTCRPIINLNFLHNNFFVPSGHSSMTIFTCNLAINLAINRALYTVHHKLLLILKVHSLMVQYVVCRYNLNYLTNYL